MVHVVSVMQMLVCTKAATMLLAADFRWGGGFWVHTLGILYFHSTQWGRIRCLSTTSCFR